MDQRVRQAVSQAADWLHHAATDTRGVVLAGAVGTGSTVDCIVRVHMRRTITSRSEEEQAAG